MICGVLDGVGQGKNMKEPKTFIFLDSGGGRTNDRMHRNECHDESWLSHGYKVE